MRALSIERFGDTPQLSELPGPEPGPGRIQVAIEAAAINPLARAADRRHDRARRDRAHTGARGRHAPRHRRHGRRRHVRRAGRGSPRNPDPRHGVRPARRPGTRLGATGIVDRAARPLDRALRRLAPEGLDAVLDLVGDRSLTSGLAGMVKDGGVLLSTAFGLDDQLMADARIQAAHYSLDRKPGRLGELMELVTAGSIRPVIGTTLPLSEAPRALTGDLPAARLRGRTVLQVR